MQKSEAREAFQPGLCAGRVVVIHRLYPRAALKHITQTSNPSDEQTASVWFGVYKCERQSEQSKKQAKSLVVDSHLQATSAADLMTSSYRYSCAPTRGRSHAAQKRATLVHHGVLVDARVEFAQHARI
jgi:hypothetical protein